MRNRIGKLLALTMVMSVLLSTFGIAKISHFCRLTAHPVSITNCESNDQHNCCNSENSKQEAGSCCTTVIKMYQADLQSLFKTPIRVAHEMVMQVVLLNTGFEPLVAVRNNFQNYFEDTPVIHTGKNITIQICSFLI